MKTRSLRVVAGAVAVGVSVLGGAFPAHAQVAPPNVGVGGGDVIEVGPGGGPTAAITIFADCVVRSGVNTVVWFGFTNSFGFRRHLDVGVDNAVAVGGVAQANAGQVTQFLAGETRRAFAVRFGPRTNATWTINSPTYDPATGSPAAGTIAQTATSAGAPPCGAGAPTVSATAQITQFVRQSGDGEYYPVVKPTVRSLFDRRDASGKLVDAYVGYSLDNVRSVCSAGGTPLPPAILWGFGGPTNRNDGFFLARLTTTAGYRPAWGVVRTDADANYSFARTYIGVRQVKDPQLVTDFSGGDPAAAAILPTPKGLSSEKVIADVFGRCLTNGRVVTSQNPVWVDSGGYPFYLFTTTDEAAQSTRAAVFCRPAGTNPPGPLLGCDVPLGGPGPGGRTFR
jgi:hypothetical protein